MHTPRYPVFWNEDVRPFRVRLVRKGARFGLRWWKIHNEGDALVEVYDASYGPENGFSPFGQFTGGRYYVSALLADGEEPVAGRRLELTRGVGPWTLDGSVTMQIDRWLRHELTLIREPERFVLWCDECSHYHPHTKVDEVDEDGWGPVCCNCMGPHKQLKMVCEIEKGELIG